MKKWLAYGSLVGVALVIVAGSLAYWLGTREQAMPPAVRADSATLIERGRYLAQVGNCAGCHTARDGQPYAGGRPIATPFGTLYGPNITPDVQTGIGNWSAEDFWRALHEGKGPGGRLLYPAFPYTEYTRMPREDVDALFAYFRTLPAVRQASRAPELDWPYDQRALLAGWRALNFRAGELQPDPTQSIQWNRGRYLVQGPGHCAACHAPPLNSDALRGLGTWSAEDIATLLRHGTAAPSVATGPMAEVVRGSTQHLTESDAQAIGLYLKSLPPAVTLPASKLAPAPAVLRQGERLYVQQCASCHQDNGRGHGQAWPALAMNSSVTAASALNVIHMVLDGGFAPATSANPRPHGMPPFGPFMDDNDIAAVVTYIRSSWGNNAGAVTPLEVKRARQDPRP
ncbi:c-type cytochrome [Bordetella holmesii]|uniref:Cytochrome C n=2 Tax=Bordetella holmesii TaxID=35814 RepID=A0A158M813_9BORD|nr:c-type cytochrome [Bordetella holmesii]AHV94423.1 cytochrome c family protein [Bordetella holmesii ATCC 51541]AIT26484.1 cytochrome c family protein [Bordetella holmesii 44057]EWM43442.1 cytochrome c family protein [Bordetella holmesii 41130]EWM47059.1 cytochrome c family protein [Bordetella holmesii 35009]EWM51225.1 cytochrome c family protein [Bordetella holmesii 70147]